MIIGGIIIGLFSVGLIVAASFLAKKKYGGENVEMTSELQKKISACVAEIEEQTKKSVTLMAKGQLDSAQKQLDETKTGLAAEKALLKESEQRLETCQKLVEEKEKIQQDLKTVKADDESKVAAIMENFETLTDEAKSLEQKLAASLRNVDEILKDVSMTDDQRALLQDLNTALTEAGARLRELIMEYHQTHERLETLQQQHQDLEEEYTRLVEQQLGD